MAVTGNLSNPEVISVMGMREEVLNPGGLYPSLLFWPVEKKNESSKIRSLSSKEEKALLSRLQEVVFHELSKLSKTDLNQLALFLGTDKPCIPVPLVQQKKLHVKLLKADTLLFKKASVQTDQSENTPLFYNKEWVRLSADQLKKHVQSVVDDYLFNARISLQDKGYWLSRIEKAYENNPFIQLAYSKNDIVDAVEIMNKSSLLAILKYPEDISYWRERVKIVLRPYRTIPKEWRWDLCSHEKKLFPQADSRSIECTCEDCGFSVIYDINEDVLWLPQEVNLFQATKRIATIERQFNNIASQNGAVTKNIECLKDLSRDLTDYHERIETILELQRKLPGTDNVPDHPVVSLYKAMQEIELPEESHDSMLIWMSRVSIPDISILREINRWQKLMKRNLSEELNEVQTGLTQMIKDNQPRPDDTILQIKNYKITRLQLDKINRFIKKEEHKVPVHILVKLLKGEATNKIRGLQYHEEELFGILEHWPEKYITKAIIQLNKQNVIIKEKN
ncbi:RQC-minor-2 family DNA-binding protein [Salisediminibacterium beveridgei]|uniref:RQC domain-containing protein n=1 Tax=Salisediminibacterium beveridgei TaxID=632773 RepID=A0A1D7QVQ9_9BACI|nr:RQC-minor-2 family DNA-binding protein [Salisediminibacterium beveridgei]AOM83102.1 hypothetical protein BBEV_1741 [Salisediminibacterium beveridgei]